MCDTLGFRQRGISYFAKNSDRSPNEPQILEFFPAAHTKDTVLHCTYIDIPQVPETHAVLLSRPVWMWGAEMGVNDCGVVIGNEAVWTRGRYSKENVLTGMDLVRLALERSGNAIEARETIITLLTQYGQGGNCGFDHDFFYDNSFLIMDRAHIFILETAGKEWVWKETERGSITNRLTIGKDGDRYSRGTPYLFASHHSDLLYNAASAGKSRLAQTACSLRDAGGVSDLFRALRQHAPGADPFCAGSVGSVCMHFGGLVGDHTTASMVVELQPERILVWATGSSCPCVSLFKPWLFGSEACAPVFTEEQESDAQAYWRAHEQFNRGFIGKRVPDDYYAERDALEELFLQNSTLAEGTEGFAELSRACAEAEQSFYDGRRAAASRFTPESGPAGAAFLARWEKKNKLFEE